jgi:hypothetical protein
MIHTVKSWLIRKVKLDLNFKSLCNPYECPIMNISRYFDRKLETNVRMKLTAMDSHVTQCVTCLLKVRHSSLQSPTK